MQGRGGIMLRTRSIIFFAFVLVSVILFTTGEVMAFSDEPCSQSNYEYCNEPAMTATTGGWTITLNDILPEKNASGELTGNYEWMYTISDPSGDGISGSNFVGLMLPDCCRTADPDERVIISPTSVPPLTCFGVGEGEQTIYFGRYNNQAFVCKGTPDNTGNWKIVANTPYKTRSTIIIKLGKDVLQFEMAVPGCPPAPAPTEPLLGSRTFTECSNFGQDTIEDYEIDGVQIPHTQDDISFYVVRTDDRDGCVSRIYRCIDFDCGTCSEGSCPEGTYDNGNLIEGCEEVTQDVPPPGVVTQTSFTRTCPDENISVVQGSPFYLYTVNSGGYTYESCLDLGSYRWVSITNCK